MKLNKVNKRILEDRDDATTNEEGGLSFELKPEQRLFTRVLTTFFGEKKFYGNKDEDMLKDLETVAQDNPEFIIKLAMYARNEMYLRTVPQVLLVECANNEHFKGTGLIKKNVKHIVKRADEITEVLAYHLSKYSKGNHKKIPNALLRGLKEVFECFNEYNFAKYNRKGAVKLKDALRLIHPNPKDKKTEKLYKKILDDTLEPPKTWEVTLSTWQDNFKTKKDAWEAIIPEMHYMATLRNLRNFLEEGVNLKSVLKKLTDRLEVLRSKQLPFRFYSAYREIEQVGDTKAGKVLEAIEKAMEISVHNLPKLKGKTFISADNSGSMGGTLSDRSSVTYCDIGNLMQAISVDMCNESITSVFGEDFQVVNLSKRSSILDRAEKGKNTDVGHSTNGYKIVEYMTINKIKVDRLIVFTDMQMYNDCGWYNSREFSTSFEEYRKKVNPKCYLYLVDLSGHGDVVYPVEGRVALISGWSEKILKFINYFEADGKTMIDEINNYDLLNTEQVIEEIKKVKKKIVKKKAKKKRKNKK